MPNDTDVLAFQIARLAIAYLVHSTLLLGGTWLFLRAARVRSWALRERLWKLAVIIPLVTAAIPLPAPAARPAWLNFEPLAPQRSSSEPAVAQIEELKTHSIVAVPLSDDEAKALGLDDAVDAAEPIVASQEERQLPAVSSSTDLRTTEIRMREKETTPPHASVAVSAVIAICYAVLTFFIFGALHVIRRSLVFARSLRDCRPIMDESVCGVLADLLRKTNMRRRVRLLGSAADRPPAAFGLYRWTIVLPDALIPTLKPDELRALLAHEVAHLARGDALWLWIGRILCACFAFQPLNFLARAQLRLAAEFLSDEWAVRNSASRFALARCLTRVAEWSAHLSVHPVELAAVGPRTNLSERVERLILERQRTDSWDSGRRPGLVWAAALTAAFGLECSAPRTSLLAEPPNRATDTAILRTDSLSRPETKPVLADALQSLNDETRGLLSELQRVNSSLKQSNHDPAIAKIAARLETRATKLVHNQARLAGFQTHTPIGIRSERNLQ